MPGEILIALAAHVLPVAGPPVRDGAVAVEDGRIVAVGPAARVQGDIEERVAAGRLRRPPTVQCLGDAVLLPGLVNAHTHLELSWLKGRVPPTHSLPAWVRSLLAARRADGGDDSSAIAPALASARQTGTVAVGDIGNTTVAFDELVAQGVHAVAFHEIIGFAVDDPGAIVDAAIAATDRLPPGETVRPALAAHAPYSVHPEVLRRLGRERTEAGRRPMSVHLGESRDEIEFLASGGGEWRHLLDDLQAWNDRWTAPGATPVAYLESLGFLGAGVVAVHGVHLDDVDLERLARLDVSLVTCPRSNEWTGAGSPPVERFYASGVSLAIGTDSLASNADLDLFREMAALRRLAPEVPASRLIRSATLCGARALGLEGALGSLEVGKSAALLSVDVPVGVRDVEEYLVSGVAVDAIRWVAAPWGTPEEGQC